MFIVLGLAVMLHLGVVQEIGLSSDEEKLRIFVIFVHNGSLRFYIYVKIVVIITLRMRGVLKAFGCFGKWHRAGTHAVLLDQGGRR